ncbi:MAG: F-box-like domain-containing protein [Rhabdochlamydiaceae bacterium]|jgi:hypothetical protein
MAIVSASMFHGAISRDADFHILSFLEEKDLGQAEQVCKGWKVLAGNDRLWRNLFIRLYNEEVPEEKSGKEACLLKRAITIDEGKLPRVVTSFLCRLKWDTKRRFECTFPNEPTYSLVIEQSFGPVRGTSEGFRGPADETEYYKYVGKLSLGQPADQTFTTSRENRLNHLPIHSTISGTTAVINGRQVLSENVPGWSYFTAEIKGVDVGYGSTLAYFSDSNGWKKPYPLFCIGQHTWVGWIPFSEFKFVKIDQKGKVTWEEDVDGGNRYWGPRCYGRPYGLEEYLRVFPVKFQN